MKVKNVLCSSVSTMVLTLGSANAAIAQGETAAEANIYQEFGWLVLALVLGYGVIARRGFSHRVAGGHRNASVGHQRCRPAPHSRSTTQAD